jgi:hypothetical protein
MPPLKPIVASKLWLHVPLWGCGVIGLLLITFVEKNGLALGVLFLVYQQLRYVWRRYLKQQGLLGSTSVGLGNAIFWGVVAIVFVIVSFILSTPTEN